MGYSEVLPSRALMLLALATLLAPLGCTRNATPKLTASRTARSSHSTEEPLSAASVLRNAEHRYATCQAYQDRGTLYQLLTSAKSTPVRSVVAFRTAFSRPSGQFYFDYTETHEEFFPPSRGVIWR